MSTTQLEPNVYERSRYPRTNESESEVVWYSMDIFSKNRGLLWMYELLGKTDEHHK